VDSGLSDWYVKTLRGTYSGQEIIRDPEGDKIFARCEGTTGPGNGGSHGIVNETRKLGRDSGQRNLHHPACKPKAVVCGLGDRCRVFKEIASDETEMA
jgi:hypothetical protein